MRSVYKNVVNNSKIRHPLSDEDIKRTQDCLIEMLKELVSVCEKHNIHPFLVYGNLIGKLRHDGFIPWDDDLDVGMLRQDYDKFVSIFDGELSNKYVISTPNANGRAYYRFVQIGRKGTRRIEKKDAKTDLNNPTSHLFIDIFPFDNVPQNPFFRKLKGMRCEFLMMIAGSVDFDYENLDDAYLKIFKDNMLGRIELVARRGIHSLFSFRSADAWYHIIDKSIRYKKKTGFLVSALGPKHYLGEICDRGHVLPLRKTQFYGVPIYIPNNSDALLRNIYGDYMTLPPEEDRQCHSANRLDIEEGAFQ